MNMSGFHKSIFTKKQSRLDHDEIERNGWKIALRIFLITLSIILALIISALGVYLYMRESGKNSLKNKVAGSPNLGQYDGAELTSDASVILNDGTKYRYKEEMISFLLIGVEPTDEMTAASETALSVSETAGSIFLLVLDTEQNTLSILGIPGDTMTEIAHDDQAGNLPGNNIIPLSLAYAFGDSERKSCELVSKTVSKLLYDLPIHGYLSVSASVIEQLTNAVGGISVKIPQDFADLFPEYKTNATVTMYGNEAVQFVQTRSMNTDGYLARMERQKQFALAFYYQAKRVMRDHPTLPFTLYQRLSEQIVTDISRNEAVYLASQLLSVSSRADQIQMLDGQSVSGAVSNEFYVSEDALFQWILQTFYTEVTE